MAVVTRTGKSREGFAGTGDSRPFRFGLLEMGGAVGDLGTLLPLAIALITLNRMSATSVFLVVGAVYVGAGLFYRLPVPVQPLKAMAAIAIAAGLSAGVISAAGLIMGIFLLLLMVTGGINVLAGIFTKPIIRGIQLGLGLLLVRAGLVLVNRQQVIIGGSVESVIFANVSVPTSWLLALILGVVFLVFLRSRKLPASLILIGLGIVAGTFWGSVVELRSLSFGLALPELSWPHGADLSAALVLLVIPQIPLTLGNAVFATADTAQRYFGSRAARVTPRALLGTMGVANVAAGLLGGMGVCHGSGGLTAHFRLGARSGAAGVMIGVVFMALALFVDGNVLPLLSLIPYPVLGVLVVFVGVQHSILARDVQGRQEIGIVLAMGVVGLVTKNLSMALAAGIGLRLAKAILLRRYALGTPR